MAMLAEPRRRQKIGPNPRGKFFLEDDDNKGRTLLQKLGWQTGNGLGRQNQGMSAPLCPKIQMDSKGLGYDVKNDPWVVHNEEFSNLLGTLEAVVPEGNESDQAAKKKLKTKGEANSSSEEDSGGRKLEKKSKSSRFRIHYHKFIKNKDVSNFSNTDLSCIFGQPTDSLINKTKKSKAGSSNETATPIIEDPFDEDGVKTINAGSMNDYFNAKMKERDLKAKEQAKEIKPETVEDEDDGLKTVNRGSMIDYFKSMMAKRRLKAEAEADTESNSADTNYKKLNEDENEEAEEEPDNNNDANSVLIPEEFDAGIEKNKIRELKRKVHEVLEIDGNDNETEPNHSEDDRTVIIKSKKSKKDKKKKKKSKSKAIDEDDSRSIIENEQEAVEVDVADEPTPTVEELLAEKKAQNFAKKEKRKKSKKRKLVTEVEEEILCDGDDDNVALLNTQDDEEPKAKKLKKSKKSKKSKKLVIEECEEMSLELEAEVPVKKAKLDKKKNKNKNKKKKHQILEEQQEQSDDVNEDGDGDGGSGSGTGDEVPDEDGTENGNDSNLNDSSSFRKRRPNKKRMSGEELKKLSMTFKGANLHRIRGYAYY